MTKYYVIGGQYAYRNYGGAKTLEGAKRLATKHEELWDNWQGWTKPGIYKTEDCMETDSGDIYPKRGTIPCMEWNKRSKKWVFTENKVR